ncbi:MAG TPA: hypothetical protein VGT05_02570 [Patescibacteria group bacterium]|nr:hypothetical protein [Patescibacteria group bacterium]
MEQQEKLQTIDTSLDGIAEFWVKIVFAHIRSQKEQKKIDDNEIKSEGPKGGENI